MRVKARVRSRVRVRVRVEVERLRRTFEKGKTATDGIACKRQNLG